MTLTEKEKRMLWGIALAFAFGFFVLIELHLKGVSQ